MPNYRGLNIQKVSFGKLDSDVLFGPLDQEVFDLYEKWGLESRYKRALDIGANIGVHSILMAHQGWLVRSFEPDPRHYDRLFLTVTEHGSEIEVDTFEVAVSDRAGRATFVRVSNNTTGSHLEGEKQIGRAHV